MNKFSGVTLVAILLVFPKAIAVDIASHVLGFRAAVEAAYASNGGLSVIPAGAYLLKSNLKMKGM